MTPLLTSASRNMLFDSWTDLGRTLAMGALAYLAIIVLLRLTGKRTLSKWNAFDFIVTIALGSTLASAILSKDVSLSEGAGAFGILIVLQYVVTWLSVRSGVVQRLIKDEPTLLLYQGRIRHEALRSERVTESELRAALRGHGVASVQEAGAVVLETDGSFTVIDEPARGPHSTLAGVGGMPEGDEAER